MSPRYEDNEEILGEQSCEQNENLDEVRPLFAQVQRLSISSQWSPSPWQKVLARGPVVLGLLMLAVGLAASTYVFRQSLPSSTSFDEYTMQVVVGHNPENKSKTESMQDVVVNIRLPEPAHVFVDKVEVGLFKKSVRLSLQPGRREFMIRYRNQVQKQMIVLEEDNNEHLVDFPVNIEQ
jgi:hypothetical protein